jgi:hypothetical protein
MWRVVLGLFLVAHGLVHAGIWTTPKPATGKARPFDPASSWLLDRLGASQRSAHMVSVVLALVAAAGFVVGGLGLLVHAAWWGAVAGGSAAVSLLLMVLYFNPWLVVGLGIELAIIAALLRAGWPSATPFA